MFDLRSYLKNNTYPGRGILAGNAHQKVFLAYFIMGRSENSRNRIFVKENGILRTKVYDETKVKDPSLIIYNAVRTFHKDIIVTNGNQTDTIYEYLEKGKSFKDALDTREYEPDAPNYTPRISACLNAEEVHLSILRKEEDACLRLYYDYLQKENTAYFLSTYDHDGDPLPPFSKEPVPVEIREEFETLAEELWKSLNSDNKISLYVREGEKEMIFNRNEEKR